MKRPTWRLPGIVVATMTVTFACTSRTAPSPAGAPEHDLPATGTFSIIAYDSASGQWGGAVQSRVFSVGNGVLWAEAGVGIAATQAIVDVSYGPQALALLREGVKPADVIKQVMDKDTDPGLGGRGWPKAGRQFAVISPVGETAVHTGPN